MKHALQTSENIQKISPICPDKFRAGMRRLAGACTIITSRMQVNDKTQWAGLCATAVSSVTAEPARLLVCVNRSVWAHKIITNSGVLGVNCLSEDELDIALRFAGGRCKQDEKFDEGDWQTPNGGAPLLSTALTAFDCRVAEIIEASTHDIFICDIVDVAIRENISSPLIYFNGEFSKQISN